MSDATAGATPRQWQYWVIDVVKRYEQQQGYDPHPVGMTMQYPVPDQSKVNDPLFNSPADWISPGSDDEPIGRAQAGRHWLDGSARQRRPQGCDLRDTDHYAAGQGDALWAWKSFLRGHHPILMDFGIIDVANPLDPSLGGPPVRGLRSRRATRWATRAASPSG